MTHLRVLVLTNMYPTPEYPAFGTFVADQVASLRASGVECDVLFLNPRESKLNYLWGPARLRRQIAAKSYDLIHAHYVFCGLIAATQRKLPVVLTQHGPEVFMYWTPPLCKLAARLVDANVVVSPAIAAVMPVPSIVIPCGINFDRFRPLPQGECRRELGLPLDKKIVLYAGELRPEKRVELLREAVATLQQEDPTVELVVATALPHGQVPLYMNAADVFALVSAGEGSPMVIKEAMACNVPIVATDVGDVAQVIGGVEGCFITGPTIPEIVANLRAALAFGRRTAGRERVAHMSQPRIAEQLIAVFEETLRRRRRTPGGPHGRDA
jgi:glycosyltransferase involved in cell wall biosynthesis